MIQQYACQSGFLQKCWEQKEAIVLFHKSACIVILTAAVVSCFWLLSLQLELCFITAVCWSGFLIMAHASKSKLLMLHIQFHDYPRAEYFETRIIIVCTYKLNPLVLWWELLIPNPLSIWILFFMFFHKVHLCSEFIHYQYCFISCRS